MISFILSNLKDWKVFFSRSRSWVVKGGWAITDQAFFSGANFLVNILLARWLPPKEYGAFAVTLSVFYLLAGFHTALITEPMTVFGAGKYREQFRKYFSMVLWGHWGISMLIAFGLSIAAWIFFYIDSLSMARALLGLALASPLLLFLGFARRGCYVYLWSSWTAKGSAINFLLVLVGIFLMWYMKILSSFSGLIVLGIAAGVSAFILIIPLRSRLSSFEGNLMFMTIIKEHIKYGRWAVGSALLVWVPWNIAYTLLPSYAGLIGSAEVKATINFISPVLQTNMALSFLMLPYFSIIYKRHGVYVLRQRVVNMLGLFTGIAFVYALFISLMRNKLLKLVYGGKYENISNLIVIASILPILASICTVVAGALRAMERPDFVFRAYIFSTIIALTFGIIFIIKMKVIGAFLLMIISNFVLAIVLLYFFKKTIPKRSTNNNVGIIEN